MSEVNPAVAALIARYRTTPAAVPNVNPPEAAKVLEAQTAPEVAGVATPAPEMDVPALATAVAGMIASHTPEPAPAAVEPPKAKRGPGRPKKAPTRTAGYGCDTVGGDDAPVDGIENATTEALVAELRDRGYRVTLEER